MRSTKPFTYGIRSLLLLASAAIALSANVTHAASIVEVLYSQDDQLLARMIYTGRDGGSNSDPANYWKLIGQAPEFSYDVAIKPSSSNSQVAELKGPVTVTLTIRGDISMGIVELKGLSLVRDSSDSDGWYLSKASQERVTQFVGSKLKGSMTVTYQIGYTPVARMICYGPTNPGKAAPAEYWFRLGNAPALASKCTIKPDKKNGLEATLKGEVRIHVACRPYAKIGGNTRFSGHLDLESVRLVRDRSGTNRWYLPKDEVERITAMATKE